MANTYTQIHIQAVFAVQNRECIILNSWKEELYKYISGIVQRSNHKLLAINGMPDHIHILFGLRPSQAISDLLQDIKGSSSKWINDKKYITGKFSWQEGMLHFHIVNLKCQRLYNTSLIKLITIEEKSFHKNILIC